MYISARGYYDDKQEIYDENIMTWIPLSRVPDDIHCSCRLAGRVNCLGLNHARD
jgi:hypothetical protein